MKAAQARPEETVDRLEVLLKEMKACKDRELYIEKNLEFHRTIYQSANRPILFEIIEDLWHRISPYMYLYLKINVHSHDPIHEEILRGMRNKNSSHVGKWLRIDLQKAAKELAEQIGLTTPLSNRPTRRRSIGDWRYRSRSARPVPEG
jgi:DNA-binding GntR family transcriptional regulator